MADVNDSTTEWVSGCAFDVMNELGVGFLESVYEHALKVAMEEKGLVVDRQRSINVWFRGHRVGQFFADLVVNDAIIIELKCTKAIVPEHLAQLINYLRAGDIK